MEAPQSRHYRFEELLSESAQLQTWRAIRADRGRRCIVKIAKVDADPDGVNAALMTSFKLQRGLRSPDIVTCTSKRVEDRLVLVEYPLLNPARWQCLTPRLFWSDYPHSLVRLCLVVDFLHAFGLVHGDLKVDNFLRSSESSAVTRYLMIDLDFLCSDNTEPNARVFGTPQHIAPEIIANDRIVVQSDNYSLGVSFSRYVDALREEASLANVSADLDCLDCLIADLRSEDPMSRPSYLLEALRSHDLISRSDFESVQRELLSKIILSRWVAAGARRNINASDLRKQVVAKSNLLGIGDGLLDLISEAMKRDVKLAIGCLGNAVSEADIKRYAEYWHIGLDDDRLLDFHTELTKILGGNGTPELKSADPAGNLSTGVLDHLERLAEDGQGEYVFLRLRGLFEKVGEAGDAPPRGLFVRLLASLARMAQKLNRTAEALDYLEKLVPLLPEGSPRHGRALEEVVMLAYSLGKTDRVAALIEERLCNADRELPSELELNLYRIKGWLQALRGDYVRGDRILQEVRHKAESLNYRRVLMLTHYALAVVDWRRGQLDAALRNLDIGLDIASNHNLSDRSLALLSTLTLLRFETADYKAAVRCGKKGVRIASEIQDLANMRHFCGHIASAYIRTADFPKARYWAQRYLDLGKHKADVNHLATYYSLEGFLYLNMGDLSRSRHSLYRALGLAGESGPAKLVGNLHLNLCELAVQRGDEGGLKEHSQKARAAFENVKDTASLAEVDSMMMLWRLIYDGLPDSDDALPLVERLTKHNCRYSAARLLFHLILAHPDLESDRLASLINPLRSAIRSTQVPLFRALSSLIDACEREDPDNTGWLESMKYALRETLKGEARFPSLILCKSIGKLYLNQGKSRHGAKYLSQANRLAASLSNRKLAHELSEIRAHAAGDGTDPVSLVNSFHGVSEILKEIAHSDRSYRRLLEFALDETGAERAVLLLRRGRDEGLYVAASLHCDRQSEEEITGISQSVAGRTIAEINPMIVDNALSDSRTKNYSSIVAHNILSVACVPLVHRDQQQGVLYLDHNTLPSLFSSVDIKYLRGISNFLSMIIATMRAYQGLSQTNVQLREDLARRGGAMDFITADPNTLAMLERLPEIAYAEVPVLIQGESGTGKEIMCEMLHRGSRRSDRPLVKLNCAAIADTMVEGELFGIAKNAATGVSERQGKLAAADGGTLLLDEVADMPLDTQAKLLRAIEFQRFEKVGSNRPVQTDIRFVCATNKNLVDEIREGRFRRDLYYRINTIVIEIPPLRDRISDIELLLEHFLETFSVDRPHPQFDADTRQRMKRYAWPGNVRELRNFVERCCILFSGRPVDATVFRDYVASVGGSDGSESIIADQERTLIRRTLHATNWNQTQAANRLGIPLSTLRRRIKKYGLRK